MMGWNDAVTRDWCEARECQQFDGQRSRAVTLRDTHSDIFMGDRQMSERERIAYEELRPGDIIEEGDEWWPKDGTGQWQAYHQGMFGLQVLDASIARRPYRISPILEIGDALADAQKAATQLQVERDEARAALKAAQRARDELQLQVDELRAERTDEVTARQVQQVLHRWATELEWSADCFGSAHREQVHGVQNTLIAVMQRIESMIDAESSRANA